jgi:preprotein translocase subunit SecF
MIKNLTSVAALLSLLFASGCLFESNIDANGGGTMQVSTYVAKDTKLESIKKQMTSADVEVTEAKMAADNNATFKLEFKDITKLSTTKFFAGAKTTRTVDSAKGTTSINTLIKHEKKQKVPDAFKKLYNDQVKIVTTVPGEITETNATSKEGRTATWVFTLDEFYDVLEVPLNLTYKNPS